MESEETPVSTSLGSINLDAKPKKSILKRCEPESSEPAGGGDGEGAAGAGRHHVPFSHIIPELSRLDGLGGASADRGNSDLQSVSSAASLSPLSSDDEQLDGAGGEEEEALVAPPAAGGSSLRHVGPARPGSNRNNQGQQRRRRNNNRRGRCGPRGPPGMPEREEISPHPLPPPGTESSHHLAGEKRSPSPMRLVRYSPSPERQLHVRHSRSRSRSPVRRSPARRPRARRSSRSRSPRRRSRSPGRHRRGRSPRYHRSPPGRRRGWSRSPTPRRRRTRTRSRSPPWGRNVERSLLAMSRPKAAPAAGYGPPAGMPGYPAMQYAAPHPLHPYMPQPMPYPMPMVPGMNQPFGQPMYAPPGAPMYLQAQPQPPAAGMSVPAAGVSERIDSDTVLREIERRRQQKPARQLTEVPTAPRDQTAPPAAAATATAETTPSLPPHKLPSEEVVSEELAEIRKKKPWFTQELVNMKLEMADCKKRQQPGVNKKYFRLLAKQWNHLVLEAKQKMGLIDMPDAAKKALEGGKGVAALPPAAIKALTAQHREHVDRRDRLAGELHQLKLEQKTLDSSNIVMKRGQPASNYELHDNLKRQGEMLKALEWEVAVVAQLKKVFDPACTDPAEAGLNGIGNALVKAAKAEADGGSGAATSKSEVAYLLLGDETLSAVQVYIREQESRAAFGTTLPAERIRLVSRPDAALSSVEFRHWVRAAVRQSAAETLVLLASAGCLETETGTWSAAAAVTPLLPLLRDLRADGLTRVVVVGVPVRPGAAAADRATQFNRALQEQLETAGPHVPRVTYTPIKGGPQDGFGEQTEGGLTLDLYRTLLQIIAKCEQKPESFPSVPESSESSEQTQQLDSVHDAVDTLQNLLYGLRGRLAGDEAAGLGAVAALLDKMKSEGDGLQLRKQEEQNLAAEDPAVFFRDPADHVCLHCEMIFLNAKAYLEHLKGADHVKKCQASQNAPEAPWRKDIPPIEKKTKNAQSKPIKGLDMFIRVECWYCKVCEMFVGDLRCASSHLKSRRHNVKYDDYLENNPSYHAVVGETRSRLLLECASREQERTRRRLREDNEKRGDRLNERMRRQSEGGGVQDVTDEAGAAGAGAAGSTTPVTPPAAGKKKTGIKLNLLAAPTPPPEELGHLKRKVQANLAVEQEAKRLKEEVVEKETKESAEGEEEDDEVKVEQEGKQSTEELVPTVSNQPVAAAATSKVKITLVEKAPQKPATSGAPAKKKVMPIVGKLPKLRTKKLAEVTKTEKPAEAEPAGQLSKSDLATLELANKPEVLASIPAPAAPPPAPVEVPEPQTEAISDDDDDQETPGDMLDLLDIDLPDADDSDRRANAEELKMLGICDEDVAAQQLPATRPPP